MHSSDSTQLLTQLVERHYALLYRYAYRLTGAVADAEDLTQQTFLTAQTKLDQLRDVDRGKSWLCAILRNLFLKDQRSGGTVNLSSVAEIPEPVQVDVATLSFDQEQLQAALLELPEEFRSPLVLFYFEEFSYKEIAEQMEVPVGTVMSRLARAKCWLRKRLTVPEPDPAYTT